MATSGRIPAAGGPVIRFQPMRSPAWRAAAALLLFSTWMGLLFAGFLLRGALHLLLLGAAALFPWRSLPAPADAADSPCPSDPEGRTGQPDPGPGRSS
jgi:hypothetical protein